jgi:hypothetical protein
MSEVKFCTHCGSKVPAEDRFCADCGFDTLAAGNQVQPAAPAAPPPPVRQDQAPPPGAAWQPPAKSSTGGKGALLALIIILGLVFLGGGGLYWWFSRGEDPTRVTSPSSGNSAGPGSVSSNQAAPAATAPAPALPAAGAVDLSRGSTYFPEPGLKCTFFVNYPDGMSGVVERVSALVVSDEAVRVSEVETGVDMGEAYGFGFHYVERADGTYYILDQTPMEMFPFLKNNLTPGQTWSYADEFGQITWTVLEMGVDLDLGFTSFKNCLVVKEDNQAAGVQSVTYYAPGRGSVLVRSPSGTVDYYKMTALSKIDEAQAAGIVKQWSPNHKVIRVDRAQN